MKRFLALLILSAMMLSLIACGESKNSEKSQESEKSSTSEKTKESESEKESEQESEKESETEELPDEYSGDGDDIIYVNPNYEGFSNGAKETPYTTIKEAVDYVYKTIFEDGVEANYVIYLCQGTHILEDTLDLTFTKEQKANIGNSTIRFFGSSKGAVLTSNYSIAGSDFVKESGRPYSYYVLPDEFKDENGLYPAIGNLIQNDQTMLIASSKKKDARTRTAIDSARRITDYNLGRGVSKDNNILYLNKNALDMFKVPTNENGEFIDDEGNPILVWFWIKDEWEIHKLRATGIKLSTTIDNSTQSKKGTEFYAELSVYEEDWTKYIADKNNKKADKRELWLENHFALLDDPGEFYYDQTNGVLYVIGYEGEDFDKSVISFPRLDTLISCDNLKNVSFYNIEFVGTTWQYDITHRYYSGQAGNVVDLDRFPTNAAIFGKDCTDIVVDGCTFRNTALDAIYFTEAATNIQVTNNRIMHVGGTAIRFGAKSNMYNEGVNGSTNIQIENNYIYDIATRYQLCPSIYASAVKDIKIKSNTIIKTSYTAISLGWSWGPSSSRKDTFVNVRNAEIAYNYIEEYMMALQDGGAIYTLGGNNTQAVKERFNEVHHNVIVENKGIAEDEFGLYLTIYHDGSSSHWHDYDNIVIRDYENLKPEPDFIYYYQAVLGQQAYSNDMTSSYTIGLADEYRLHLISGRSRYTDVALSMNADGSFNIDGLSLSDSSLTFTNAYCFADFEAAKANTAVYKKMEEIYRMTGTTLVEKPREFGVLPTYD